MLTVGKYFFILALNISVLFGQQKNAWELKKDEHGITVFTRMSEESDFKELKSVVCIKTSLSSIVALLNDWDSYPNWVYRCGKSNTLKKISDTEVIHYQTVVAPWPADNRDFVVHVSDSQDPSTKIVRITSVCTPDYIPKVPDHVRITEFRAAWTLVPQKDGMVEITYQLLVNPGGYVPAWLVNMAVVDGPYETMVNFKEWIKKDKYQKAKIPYIKD
jgi:hypothetical protein